MKTAPPLTVSAKVRNKLQEDISVNLRRAFEFGPRSHITWIKVSDTGRSAVEMFDLKGTSSDLASAAIDLRGQARDVFPIQAMNGWTILLGVRFSWRKVKSEHQYVGSQLILFLQSSPDEDPKQFLRLEWEGCDSDGCFEASHAAHPHWQVDIVRKEQLVSGPSATSGFGFSPASAPQAVQALPFAQAGTNLGSQPRPTRQPQWLSSIHFAAAAAWASEDWGGAANSPAHATGPASAEALSRWTSSACLYLYAQLSGALAGA